MSTINVNPDELEELASDLGRLESYGKGIKHKLQWEYQAVHGVYWELDHTYAGSLYHKARTL